MYFNMQARVVTIWHPSAQSANSSLQLEGKAIDITMPGRQLTRIRQAAADLRQGEVGIYSRSGFVHMDTGRVRYWGA